MYSVLIFAADLLEDVFWKNSPREPHMVSPFDILRVNNCAYVRVAFGYRTS